MMIATIMAMISTLRMGMINTMRISGDDHRRQSQCTQGRS